MSQYGVQRDTAKVGLAAVLTTAALPTLFFLTPLLAIMVPRIAVVLLCVLAVAVIAAGLAEGMRPAEMFQIEPALVALGLTAIYLVVNASWSLDPLRAFGKAGTFTLFAGLSYGAVRAATAWPQERLKRTGLGLAAGVALGTLFLLLQLLTHQALTIALFNQLHLIHPVGHKAVQLHAGRIEKISAYELNRGVGALTLSLWPALLALASTQSLRWGRRAAVLLFLSALIVIAISEHDTSQVALPISMATFVLALFWPRATRIGVVAAWCLAFVLVVPASNLAFDAGLHHAKWLPFSARARIILWAYTAEHVSDHPWLGIGISSTRTMDADPDRRAEVKAAQPKDYAAGWWAGPHAHNEYLQTWYELGLIGVVLFAVAGALVIWGTGWLPPQSQPYMLAHCMAFWMITASGWGMWQSWLMALPGLAAIYAAITAYAASGSGASRDVPRVP